MPNTTPEKLVIPVGGDTYNYLNEMKNLAASIRAVVPVTNRAEADAIVTAMANESRPVTDANPLFVFNNDTKNLEIRDSSGWRPMVSTNPMGHAGVTTGFQLVSTGITVNLASAQLLRGGMTFQSASNSLIMPYTGLYRFNVRVLCSSGQAGYTNYVQLRKNTAATGIYMEQYKPTVRDDTITLGGILPLAAGDAMSLYIETDTDHALANTWGTDGYNGTYIECEMIGT